MAVSTQESRPILTGIHLVLSDSNLFAVATDSHRLAQRKINLPQPVQQNYDVIIPGKSLTELSRMISDNQSSVELRIAENQVLFVLGNTMFYSRLLEGNYPETNRLIPESEDTTVELNAASFFWQQLIVLLFYLMRVEIMWLNYQLRLLTNKLR